MFVIDAPVKKQLHEKLPMTMNAEYHWNGKVMCKLFKCYR